MPELTETQRRIARHIMHRHFPGRRVCVFGSRATGKTKPWSDLDLAILGEKPTGDLSLAEARADFEESDLPFRVDLVPWRDLPAVIQQHVMREGVPL